MSTVTDWRTYQRRCDYLHARMVKCDGHSGVLRREMDKCIAAWRECVRRMEREISTARVVA